MGLLEGEGEEQEHGSLSSLCTVNSFVFPSSTPDPLFTKGFCSTETGEQPGLSTAASSMASGASSTLRSEFRLIRVCPFGVSILVTTVSLFPDQSKFCVRHRRRTGRP